MPRGRYDDIIKIIDQDLADFKGSSSYPKLLLQRELARYIKTKDSSNLRQLLKDIEKEYPQTLEAKMNYWDL